ncbi:hypothetical protein EJB05_26955, partial [Eragrostis curvula]
MTGPPKRAAAPPPHPIPGSSGSSAAGPWWGAPPSLPQAVRSPTAPPIQMDEANKGVQDWGMGSRPPNGFVSFLNNPWNPHQYQHFSSHSINDHAKGTPSESQTLINLDSPKKNRNSTRTDKRLPWQKEEETNLVSAWLENSTDPINGNCKKTDRYWGDVTNAYNSTIPENRARTSKQLKDHFQKIKKKVGWFCAAWKDANLVYASGQSDDQLWDKAQKMYEEDYQDGPFMMKHCWLLLRDKPKWHAILEDKKRKVDGEGEVGEDMPFAVAQSEDRPMGTKRAKEECNGKGKAKVCPQPMEDILQQLTKIQGTPEDRNEMLETQKRVSSENLESARLNHLAAKENAKVAMLETYQTLIGKETSGLSDDVKAELVMALKCMRESIFTKTQ